MSFQSFFKLSKVFQKKNSRKIMNLNMMSSFASSIQGKKNFKIKDFFKRDQPWACARTPGKITAKKEFKILFYKLI